MARQTGCIITAWVVILVAPAARAPAIAAIENHNLTVLAQEETAEQFVERVKKAIKNDEWGRARSGLKHALALKKDCPEAYFLFAQVFKHEGENNMAIAALDEGLKYQPVYPEARLLLARYLSEAHNLKRARDEANLAIGQGAPRFPAYRLLGEIDSRESKYEAAVTAFETALQFATVDDSADIPTLRERIEPLKRFSAFMADKNAANIVRPIPLNAPAPQYTEAARAQKIQGTVVLAVLVTERGDVGSVWHLAGLGYGLDEAAVEAARQLKFSPATKDGKPVIYWTAVQIEFNLR